MLLALYCYATRVDAVSNAKEHEGGAHVSISTDLDDMLDICISMIVVIEQKGNRAEGKSPASRFLRSLQFSDIFKKDAMYVRCGQREEDGSLHVKSGIQ